LIQKSAIPKQEFPSNCGNCTEKISKFSVLPKRAKLVDPPSKIRGTSFPQAHFKSFRRHFLPKHARTKNAIAKKAVNRCFFQKSAYEYSKNRFFIVKTRIDGEFSTEFSTGCGKPCGEVKKSALFSNRRPNS